MPSSSGSKAASAVTATAATIALGHIVGIAYVLWIRNRNSSSSSSFSSASSASSGPKYVLAGDIGGTNSRLSLHRPDSKDALLIVEYRNDEALRADSTSLSSTAFKSFAEGVVEPFLRRAFAPSTEGGEGLEVGDVVACFACAGPVSNNRVVVTNIKSLKEEGTGEVHEVVISGKEMEESMVSYMKHVVRCKIVNDFVGQGYGAVDLDLGDESKEVVELKGGSRELLRKAKEKASPSPSSSAEVSAPGPMACVGAGTGLGQCYLTCSSLDPLGGYECYPSEGGHVEYAPRTDLEMDMLRYLKDKFGGKFRISVERVVSGKGLANVYEFLAKKYPDKINKSVHDEFLDAGDMQGRVVGMNSKRGTGDPLCVQAMEIMMSAYGSEVGSAALKYIPTGGMFVTGGLTPKNLDWMTGEDSPFMSAYLDKGRVSPVLDSVPLFAVLAEDLGLRGARVCAMREYNNIMSKK